MRPILILRRSLSICVLAIAALIFVQSAGPIAAEVSPRGVEITNSERQKAGLAPLAANPDLAEAAEVYARVLANGECFEHSCGPLSDLRDRAAQAGYTGWTILGENIDCGPSTPEDVLAKWMGSAPHRGNILDPRFTEVGIAMVKGSRPEPCWVMVFGSRGASAPAVSAAATAPSPSADYALANGWFYTQASGQPDRGFAVTNEAGVAFWSEFQRLGGVDGVGYPISQRFVWNGFPSQAFQKMVFQWRADEGRVYAVNVLDLLHEQGRDDWLRAARSTPGIADWSSDAGKPWPEVVAAHQALLTDPDLRAAYFAVSDPVTIYGLPMAPVQNLENVLVLRAQRGVLQKWLVDTPWASAGQVTVANSGDLAKEAGLLPADALVPQPAR